MEKPGSPFRGGGNGTNGSLFGRKKGMIGKRMDPVEKRDLLPLVFSNFHDSDDFSTYPIFYILGRST